MRSFTVDGSTSYCPEAFAKDIQAAHRYSIPLRVCFDVAKAIWNLPDPQFTWEGSRVLREQPKGYCKTCGVGWPAYVACSDFKSCDFVIDGGGNPTPEWPASVEARGPSAPEGDPPPVIVQGSIGPSW